MDGEEAGAATLSPSAVHAVLATTDSGGFVSLRHHPPSRAERYALGVGLRQRVRRSTLGVWALWPGRPDIVAQAEEANAGRLPSLLPIRIGRMIASPYAFLRGSAAVHA